ncbi:MAG: stage VI sporulation protein F [Tenericutes bacterium]|nr:stage VI sporulation protein F [Mycoplasmatota bacterium]
MFGDNFFKKVEKKTHINKDTIFSLAAKLQKSNMQDENTIREVIHDLSNMTGKEVSKEKEEQIIDAIKKNKVPKDMNNMF